MPIKFVVIKDDNHNDIDIFLTKIFNIRIDFDDFIRYVLTTKENRNKITLESIKHNYGVYQRSSNIIASLTKMIRIRKLTFIIKTKSNSIEADTWGFVGSWIIFGYFQNYVHQYFKRVDNEYYNHQIAPNFNFNFDCHFNIRLFYIIFALIKNMKDIPKIIRFVKKGSKVYGTTTSNI
jgi:hypothetical protein